MLLHTSTQSAQRMSASSEFDCRATGVFEMPFSNDEIYSMQLAPSAARQLRQLKRVGSVGAAVLGTPPAILGCATAPSFCVRIVELRCIGATAALCRYDHDGDMASSAFGSGASISVLGSGDATPITAFGAVHTVRKRE